jgi:hypothetical protein
MKLFYGWIIVGVGIVVTCVGFGAMFSLGVFLQPMSAATGRSRTGISTAALFNFLCMGIGSFAWGGLSDRLGTRAVGRASWGPLSARSASRLPWAWRSGRGLVAGCMTRLVATSGCSSARAVSALGR